MVTVSSVTFHDVNVFKWYSQHFNTHLVGYTEIKYQLNHLFFMNMKFDELLSGIGNVLQERRV